MLQGNDLTMDFFKTGTFVWPKFFSAGFTWQHPGGRPPCDFFGLNYYGRCASCRVVYLVQVAPPNCVVSHGLNTASSSVPSAFEAPDVQMA